MKRVFSVVWKIFAVAALCVIVFLFLQVVGEADSIVEQYEQLTGNSIGATNSIKIVFLRDYIQHTGNTDILLTLGVTPAEAELILGEDLLPEESAEPEDDRQTPSQDETGNGSGSSGNQGGGQDNSGNQGGTQGGSTGGSGTTSGGNAGFMKQSDPVIAQLKGGSSSTTMSNSGCGIVALYNAYCANVSNPISMKEMLLKYSKDKLGGAVKEDSNGNLQGKIGSLAEGDSLWSWMASNYYNPGSVTQGGGKTVNQCIPNDGTYIVYFNHADSGQHWVYATKSGGSWAVQNPNSKKEGSNIGGLTCRKFYKIS